MEKIVGESYSVGPWPLSISQALGIPVSPPRDVREIEVHLKGGDDALARYRDSQRMDRMMEMLDPYDLPLLGTSAPARPPRARPCPAAVERRNELHEAQVAAISCDSCGCCGDCG